MRWPSFIVAAALVTSAAPAWARSQRDLAYGMTQAWTAAIRLLRLDMGCEVTERDRDAGFLLFQYVDGETRHPGSMEVVERALPDGRMGVRVVISIPGQPSYVELHLLDRLARKMRQEIGPPPPSTSRRRSHFDRGGGDREEETEAEEEDQESSSEGEGDGDDES